MTVDVRARQVLGPKEPISAGCTAYRVECLPVELREFFSDLIQPHTHVEVSWHATFACRGLDVNDYRLTARGYEPPNHAKYTWAPRSGEGPAHEFLVPKTLRRAGIVDDIVTREVTEHVLWTASAGGLYGRMSRAKYEPLFGELRYVCDHATVCRMIDCCNSKRDRNTFRRNFVDNWNLARNFMAVWVAGDPERDDQFDAD